MSNAEPVTATPKTTATQKSTNSQLAGSSSKVAIGTLLSRITGLLRVVAVALALGDDQLGAIYALANQSPNLIYELLIGGVLSATLVPIFVSLRENNDQDAESALFSVGIVVIAVLALLAVVGAPIVAWLYGIDGSDSERYSLMVALSRLILPEIFFYGFTTFASALLHSRQRFLAPAFTPVVNNIIVVSVMAVVYFFFDTNTNQTLILILGIGTTAGIAAMALLLIPALRNARISLRFNFAPTHPVVKRVVRMSGWTVGYVLVNQLTLLVIMNFLRSSSDRDVTAYINAFMFFQLPHGLIAVTIMTITLPTLSSAWARNDEQAFSDSFVNGFRLLAAGIIPAACAYAVVAGPLTQLVFRTIGSRYSQEGAILTGHTLVAFALGLPAFSAYLYILRSFYAGQDTRTPFLVNVFENFINVVLALLFVGFGAVGIASSFSVAYWAAAIVAASMLWRRAGSFAPDVVKGAGNVVLRVAAASITMMAAMAIVTRFVDGTSTLSHVAAILSATIVGIAVYVGVAKKLGIREIRDITDVISSRLNRT